MKKFLLLAAMACMAVFTSCDMTDAPHTGDPSGNLYGIWALTAKTVETTASDGSVTTNTADYTDVHFYLALSEFPVPHAIVKEGSLSALDLDDVDVDAAKFSYNADKKTIHFSSLELSLWSGLKNMTLIGTFNVVELGKTKLILKQTVLNTSTIYSFTRTAKSE